MKYETETIDETIVTLDTYNSDLNLVIDGSKFSAQSLSKEGFAFMWAGARATHGADKGKFCYEVKVLEHLDVSHLPADEPNPHVVRVGFSVDSSTMQLGEDPQSYGYGGTGKISTNCQFKDFGPPFMAGDCILAVANMTSDPIQIGFAKNGKFIGWAYKVKKSELQGKALFPHVLSKNCSFEVNFGQRPEPYFKLPEPVKDFTFIGCLPMDQRIGGTRPPARREDCEMIMMCGLPGAGKSVWAAEYSLKHPEKKFNVLGTNNIIDKMKVMGLPRKRNYHGRWDVLIQMATKCLNSMFAIGSKLRRNYILDQTNVYPTAQRRKMRNFDGFKRRAVVVVPTEEEYKRRCDKRDREEGKEIPDHAVLEMKANFKLPDVNDIFDEVIFTELQREEAEKLVRKYNEEGKSCQPPPRKQFRPNEPDSKRFDYGKSDFGYNDRSSDRNNNFGKFGDSRGDYGSGRGNFNRGGFNGGRGGFDSGFHRGDNFGADQGGFGSDSGYDSSRGGRGDFNSSYGGGNSGYDSPRGRGGFDSSRGRGRGGFDSRGGGRGGFDSRGGGRGGFDSRGSGRGGYDSNRGGYDSSRGGGRGDFDSNRGDGRGGFDSSRGGGRGGYDSRGRGRGGYDGNRGGGRAGYDSNRSSERSSYDSNYSGGRGGFDGSRGSGRGGYDSNRGGRGSFDSSRGRGRGGYDSSQSGGRGGYGNNRGGRTDYDRRDDRGSYSSYKSDDRKDSYGMYGASGQEAGAYKGDYGTNKSISSGAQKSDYGYSNYSSGSYSADKYTDQGYASSTTGDYSKGSSSSRYPQGSHGGSAAPSSSYSRETDYSSGYNSASSSDVQGYGSTQNYGYSSGSYGDYKSPSTTDSYSSGSNYTSGLSSTRNDPSQPYSRSGADSGSKYTQGSGYTGSATKTTRWSSETPQTTPSTTETYAGSAVQSYGYGASTSDPSDSTYQSKQSYGYQQAAAPSQQWMGSNVTPIPSATGYGSNQPQWYGQQMPSQYYSQ